MTKKIAKDILNVSVVNRLKSAKPVRSCYGGITNPEIMKISSDTFHSLRGGLAKCK